MDKHSGAIISCVHSTQGWMGSGSSLNKKADVKAQVSSHGLQRKDAYSGSDSHISQSGQAIARKRRVHAQVSILVRFHVQCPGNWLIYQINIYINNHIYIYTHTHTHTHTHFRTSKFPTGWIRG